MRPYDVIVRGGLWFDGTGAPPLHRHLGIRDGRVTTIATEPLDEAGCPNVIDAANRWVLPGMIDIHTHYDAEIWRDPGLRESVRHGVTSLFIGNCSLSSVYATNEDAADLFSRVEAVPREHVIATLEEVRDWTGAEGFLHALDGLPLGPNVGAFVGHSDLRAAVMGLGRATDPSVRPSRAEMREMERLLADALDAGMIGLSGMDSPLDKLDGDKYRSRALPSTYSRWRERRRLTEVLRSRGGILQSAPNIDNPFSAILYFISSGNRFRRQRRQVPTTLLVAADSKSIRGLHHLVHFAAAIGNRVFKANVRFQHLPVPFQLYSDGIDLPVFEEFSAGTAALHIRDQLERNRLLADPEYRRRFRNELDHKLMPGLWHRDFHDAVIVECPDTSVLGKSFGQIADERGIHPLDAFLDVLVANGERSVRWTTTVGNHRPKQLNALATDPNVHMGFSDAGAHLRNMAFYNVQLRLFKRVLDAERAGTPFMTIEHAVHRFTGELGAWFGIDAGTLTHGDRADFVVIDPAYLDQVEGYHEAPVEFFGGLRRMVNRNDDAVTAVGIAGQVVWQSGQFAEGYAPEARTGAILTRKTAKAT